MLILNFLQTIACPAVNIFILISGYFLSTNEKPIKKRKIIDLLLQILLYHILYISFNIVAKHDTISIKWILESLLPNDYFVSIYIAVYLLSPYYNKFLRVLESNEKRSFIYLIIILFSIIPSILDIYKEFFVSDLSLNNPIGHFGSGLGQTFVQFSLMYFIGAYIRMHNIPQLLNKTSNILTCFVINVLVLMPFIYYEGINKTDIMDRVFLGYHNPLLIGEAVLLFLLFNKMNIYSKVINKLAQSAFICYILGNVIISKVFKWDMLTIHPLLMIGYLITFLLLAYSISYIYYLVYSKTIGNMYNKLCNKYETTKNYQSSQDRR